MSTATKQQQLDQIKAEIIKNNVCPDLAKQATQLVFGDGNPDAKIVFIGEAPGKNEDLQGLPFVGAAGKFLNDMLAMIDLKREDVYITNIVKYRPPNNRDPLPDEKAEFLPYLEKQLAVIQPVIVVTLGRHSLNCFLPDLSISQVHGQPKRLRIQISDFRSQSKASGHQQASAMQGGSEERTESYEQYGEGVAELLTQQSAAKASSASGFAGRQDSLVLVLLPLFHPAAALYNGGMRQTLIDDFAKIPIILKKLT